MRRLIIGVSSEGEADIWREACAHFKLEFVEVRTCSVRTFAIETSVDAEVLSSYFVHERFGGVPKVNVSQILRTYGVAGHAPWVVSVPPLERKWTVEMGEEGTEITYIRDRPVEDEVRFIFETILDAIIDFDQKRPGSIIRIGFHTDQVLGYAEYIDSQEGKRLFAKTVCGVIDSRRSFFEVSIPDKEHFQLAQGESVVILREWFRRYSSAQIDITGEVVSEDIIDEGWYHLVEVVFTGGWLVIELVSLSKQLFVFVKEPFEIETKVQKSEQGTLIYLAEIKGLNFISLFTREYINNHDNYYVFQGDKLTFRSVL